MPLFFWFDLSLEARAKILKKVLLFFWTMTPKRHIEINWPLICKSDVIPEQLFGGDLGQCEKLSEIKPPLTGKLHISTNWHSKFSRWRPLRKMQSSNWHPLLSIPILIDLNPLDWHVTKKHTKFSFFNQSCLVYLSNTAFLSSTGSLVLDLVFLQN